MFISHPRSLLSPLSSSTLHSASYHPFKLILPSHTTSFSLSLSCFHSFQNRFNNVAMFFIRSYNVFFFRNPFSIKKAHNRLFMTDGILSLHSYKHTHTYIHKQTYKNIFMTTDLNSTSKIFG